MVSARELAVKILNSIFNQNAYSNIVLGRELNKSMLSDADKALTTEIVYGTIKYKYTIDCILQSFIKSGLKKIDSSIRNILRTAVFQIRYLDKVPEFAAVNEAVELAKLKSKGASKFVNGVLRNYIRHNDSNFLVKDDYIERLCFEYSFPQWMVSLFTKQYGESTTKKILEGLNCIPDITVRVNNLKTSYDFAWQKLENLGYGIGYGYICPEAIKIIKGRNIEKNPLFSEGLITVQDESAMLVAPSMDIQEDLIVLDLCSAPGGKTTHISELMNNTGRVFAFDIHANKLPLILDNAKRLGINNIITSEIDAVKYDEKLSSAADRVLIDVPCSGLGIIRKKPEIKWNKTMKELNSIVKIQRSIMENASRYLKKEGILLYSTCTLNKEENEENINWFIKRHSDFRLEKLSFGEASNVIYHASGAVTILPNENMDGFFIAKMKKVR